MAIQLPLTSNSSQCLFASSEAMIAYTQKHHYLAWYVENRYKVWRKISHFNRMFNTQSN